VGATYPVWREMLAGLGVPVPLGQGARVFFKTQLGKYIPGSVWPILMQVEAGRSWGASKAAMLAANLLTILLSCTTGLVVAAALLPAYDARTLGRYWWGLLAVPVLLVMLHPRAFGWLMDQAARLVRRPLMGIRLELRREVRALCWSLLSWAGFGVQLAVLAGAASGWRASVVLLSIGAIALAVPLGILFIPAPAGAGIRDVVLTLALSSAMSAGEAVTVVIASRVVLVACDLSAAALVQLVGRRRLAGAGERTTLKPGHPLSDSETSCSG
jgi:glycosyltransferase 2 family protein